MAYLTRGERFKDARTVHNQNGKQTMKAVELATGVSASLIKDLEDDNSTRSVGYEKVAALAAHYGVSADYLLSLSDDPAIKPCAVDELGLSASIVNRLMKIRTDAQLEQISIPDILDWIDDEPGQYSGIATMQGINLFLENTLNTIFFQDISSLSRAVYIEMRNTRDFVPRNPDALFFRAEHGKEEEERYIGKLMERELVETYPSQSGRFYVAFGFRKLTQRVREMTDDFKDYLERMTGVEAYKQRRRNDGID